MTDCQSHLRRKIFDCVSGSKIGIQIWSGIYWKDTIFYTATRGWVELYCTYSSFSDGDESRFGSKIFKQCHSMPVQFLFFWRWTLVPVNMITKVTVPWLLKDSGCFFKEHVIIYSRDPFDTVQHSYFAIIKITKKWHIIVYIKLCYCKLNLVQTNTVMFARNMLLGAKICLLKATDWDNSY